LKCLGLLPRPGVPTVITPGEWNILVNPLHPQFSLKWIVTGPDAYTFDARTAAGPERDSVSKKATGPMTERWS